jgi:hypothetical protein
MPLADAWGSLVSEQKNTGRVVAAGAVVMLVVG